MQVGITFAPGQEVYRVIRADNGTWHIAPVKGYPVSINGFFAIPLNLEAYNAIKQSI